MGSPRPSYGRARNDVTQGRNEYSRLGGLILHPNRIHSDTSHPATVLKTVIFPSVVEAYISHSTALNLS